MKPIVIAFSGAIGSGKSTLSSALASELECPRVSFGDYVRAEATRRGLDQSRHSLQDLGESLIKEGAVEFCASVLKQAQWKSGESIVVDGVRHVEILEALRILAKPSKFVLVFVNTDPTVRVTRLSAEGIKTKSDLNTVETHSTEVDVKRELPDIADLTVDGNRPATDLIVEIVDWMQRRFRL